MRVDFPASTCPRITMDRRDFWDLRVDLRDGGIGFLVDVDVEVDVVAGAVADEDVLEDVALDGLFLAHDADDTEDVTLTVETDVSFGLPNPGGGVMTRFFLGDVLGVVLGVLCVLLLVLL